MWVSKKRLEMMEKRVADLEKEVRNQQLEIISALYESRVELMKKSSGSKERRNAKIINTKQKEVEFIGGGEKKCLI